MSELVVLLDESGMPSGMGGEMRANFSGGMPSGGGPGGF